MANRATKRLHQRSRAMFKESFLPTIKQVERRSREQFFLDRSLPTLLIELTSVVSVVSFAWRREINRTSNNSSYLFPRIRKSECLTSVAIKFIFLPRWRFSFVFFPLQPPFLSSASASSSHLSLLSFGYETSLLPQPSHPTHFYLSVCFSSDSQLPAGSLPMCERKLIVFPSRR